MTVAGETEQAPKPAHIPDIKLAIFDYLEDRDGAMGVMSTDEERSKSATDIYEMVALKLAASPSSPASGVRVKVKPLVWQRYPEKGTMTEGLNERREYVKRAELPWGAAFLMKSPDFYSFAGAFGEELGKFHTADGAVNAFQAAFDAKVLSALGEHP